MIIWTKEKLLLYLSEEILFDVDEKVIYVYQTYKGVYSVTNIHLSFNEETGEIKIKYDLNDGIQSLDLVGQSQLRKYNKELDDIIIQYNKI